ncbi:hypothetical protein RFI_17596 [Reticulomyxa filosa]|uniref:Uncharacterized protein n=1 Tax=Reticulomyxa filosa TaxID=46433 RepID=X6N2U1_RETFI|nr:hypothetical protein RFI_17596 [Reticulomyxa filosa]|eukprot:ETO19637.1 hypothetical protein RFI_17596 [Reticulomyxa filosa]
MSKTKESGTEEIESSHNSDLTTDNDDVEDSKQTESNWQSQKEGVRPKKKVNVKISQEEKRNLPIPKEGKWKAKRKEYEKQEEMEASEITSTSADASIGQSIDERTTQEIRSEEASAEERIDAEKHAHHHGNLIRLNTQMQWSENQMDVLEQQLLDQMTHIVAENGAEDGKMIVKDAKPFFKSVNTLKDNVESESSTNKV